MAEAQWALTGLALALLVLLVLPSDQIKLGAKQLHGLIGSYTGGHTWQVTYSSQGTTSWTTRGSGGGSQAWNSTGNGDSLPNTSGLDAKCVGQVTATLTWIPATGQTSTTDPPPSQVIVTETGYAYFNGGGTTGPGVLNDGWSADTPPNSPNNIYGPHYYYSASGTHYEVKDGTSGTVTVGPFSLNASTPPVTDPNVGNDTVAVAANITVTDPPAPTIKLVGPIQDSNGKYNILVGQGCYASIVGIPNNSSNITYNWNIPGTTFQNWTVTSGQDAQGNPTSNTTFTPGFGVPTSDTVHWYWSDQATSETVTCNLQYTPPPVQGSPATSPISMTVTQKINLEVPLYSATPSAGSVQINASYPNKSGYYLYAGEGNPGPTRGMQWKVKVPTPTDFAGQSGGGWYFDQIVKPGRWKTPFGGSEKPWPINGMQGLDKAHPYPAPAGSPSPPPGMPTGSFATDGSQITSGDSPAQPLDNNYTNYRVTESFQTYVMYVPPGGDVQPVPLHEIDWNWKTTGSTGVQKPDGGWSNWLDGTSAGTVTSTSSAKQTIHPTWTQLTLPPASW